MTRRIGNRGCGYAYQDRSADLGGPAACGKWAVALPAVPFNIAARVSADEFAVAGDSPAWVLGSAWIAQHRAALNIGSRPALLVG